MRNEGNSRRLTYVSLVSIWANTNSNPATPSTKFCLQRQGPIVQRHLKIAATWGRWLSQVCHSLNTWSWNVSGFFKYVSSCDDSEAYGLIDRRETMRCLALSDPMDNCLYFSFTILTSHGFLPIRQTWERWQNIWRLTSGLSLLS